MLFCMTIYIRWDPAKRMTPEEACQHDWFKDGLAQRTRTITRTYGRRQQTFVTGDNESEKSHGKTITGKKDKILHD